MSTTITPSVFSVQDALAARKAQRPAAPRVESDIAQRALDIKQRPDTTPPPTNTSTQASRGGNVSFFA